MDMDMHKSPVATRRWYLHMDMDMHIPAVARGHAKGAVGILADETPSNERMESTDGEAHQGAEGNERAEVATAEDPLLRLGRLPPRAGYLGRLGGGLG